MEQVQHCTDLPRQVTFLAHTEQGMMGPGLGLTLPLINKKSEETKTGMKGQEKGEAGDRF